MRAGALDLSLTGTGIAYADSRGIDLTTVDTSKLSGHPRLNEILIQVAERLRYCDVIAIEDVFKGLKGDASLKLAGLHYLVRHWLWLNRIPYVLVTNAHLKLYAVGKGSGPGTDKDAVLLAVERRYGDQVKVADNNQADAFVLLAMLLDHYQVSTLPTVPNTHRAALAKVGDYLTGWPVLDAAPGAAMRSPSPGQASQEGIA